jgi:hypothetical protein
MAEHMLSMHKALASILNMKYQKIKTSTGQWTGKWIKVSKVTKHYMWKIQKNNDKTN